MKKLTIFSILFVIFINSYPQIYSFSFAPQNIGLNYVSNPILNNLNSYLSFEYGNYKLLDASIFKFAIGPSLQIDEGLYLNTGISFNYIKNPPKIKVFNEISFEIGFTSSLKNLPFDNKIFERLFLTIMFDPVFAVTGKNEYTNHHFKFAIGYKFN